MKTGVNEGVELARCILESKLITEVEAEDGDWESYCCPLSSELGGERCELDMSGPRDFNVVG